MSIITFIDKVCVQTATYWGAPASDGYGGFTFAKPAAIKVRWDERIEVISTRDGKEYSSKAVVMTNTDVDEGGYLLLGTSTATDPRSLATAYEIRRVDRLPLFRSTTEFVKTVYL
jgi:hypothetical protein